MADDVVDQFIDQQGVIRRPGSLVLPPGFVSSFPPTVDAPEFPRWDDSDIRQVISDPNRRDMAKLFPFAKYGTNQNSTSACNGFAAAGGVTRVRKLRGIDDGWVGSGSWVYSLINGHRDGGSILEDGMKVIQSVGVCGQDVVPWDLIYPELQSDNAREEAAKHKGLSAYRATTKQGLLTGLAAGYVAIAAIMVGPRFDAIQDGVAGVQNGVGNHAVLIEDLKWRDNSYQFLMCNSWGINYGDNGRVWLRWEHFEQPFESHVFYLIPSSQEG